MNGKNRSKQLLAAVISTVAAGVVIISAPSRTNAAVVASRDIAHSTAASACMARSGWQCCVWVGYWSCASNSAPKTLAVGLSPECVGIAPGEPIPDEIQKDIDRQKRER